MDETNGTARTDSTPDAGSADVRPQFISQIHINKYVLGEHLIMNDKWSVLRKPCARICVYAPVSEIQGVLKPEGKSMVIHASPIRDTSHCTTEFKCNLRVFPSERH